MQTAIRMVRQPRKSGRVVSGDTPAEVREMVRKLVGRGGV